MKIKAVEKREVPPAGKFNPTSKVGLRAVQAWQILVGKAMNRQTITYVQLSRLMFPKESAGVLSPILGHIAFYCIATKLPQINVIVVNRKSGKPGKLIPISGDAESIDEHRELVYRTDWYDIIPPSLEDMECAYSKKAILRPKFAGMSAQPVEAGSPPELA